MSVFTRRDGILHVESVALPAIAARFGTPCFVYSRAALEAAYRAFDEALAGRDHLICYAMKANSSLAILDVLAQLGSGFDIVSGGELARALAAGADPGKIVFSGIGKTEFEIRTALEAGILCFNVESAAELARIARLAADLKKRAPVSLRVNPDVDPMTHPYISTGLKENKFGVAYEDALRLYRDAAASPHLDVAGLDFHIGSQLTDVAPFVDAFDRVLDLVDTLAREGIRLRHLDIGGGLGIRYRAEQPPEVADYVRAMLAQLGDRPHKVLLEPGRALVGNAGLLLTRVEYLKPGAHRNFAIVDAAMNDLMRPALYDAWHDIAPVVQRSSAKQRYDVVGPVCESGDFIGRSRDLAVAEGDLLAVMSAGAYGMSMSSNYNARPRAAEILVDGGAMHQIRARESLESLYAGERRLPR
ncbi:MAG: diaminopimelate decarboxylase [Betaproteobacteria bacterium]|jgi:diaminopimelate decarboxylase|nr:diaminopimelate decarboxylase [Betaproteobacteria bacterium]